MFPQMSISNHLKIFINWLNKDGKALFTYATEDYTGSKEFDGYKYFMEQELFYSHKTPDAVSRFRKNRF